MVIQGCLSGERYGIGLQGKTLPGLVMCVRAFNHSDPLWVDPKWSRKQDICIVEVDSTIFPTHTLLWIMYPTGMEESWTDGERLDRIMHVFPRGEHMHDLVNSN